MAGLLDFFQGASNAAASNISAPVDGLAWLLKQAGMNIENPVGGSDWMRQKGLTAKPENEWAGLLGESVGGLAPIIAAAKAPQIAKGLLQGAENLAVPRTMNPQTGAVVWHGSPHKFDKFDASKIGTGEGNQVYGHGLYLAEAKDVAKGYADDLSMRYTGQSQASIKAQIKETMDTMQGPLRAQTLSGLRADLEMAKQASRSGGSSVYKVDLPDEHIAKMLDWDKPFNEQSKYVQQTIKKSDFYKQAKEYHAVTGASYNDPSKRTGEGLLKYMRAGTTDTLGDAGAWSGGKTAEEYMRNIGIPGIRYLDGGSRGAGAGSSNYVVFPGNEGLLSILERNGQSFK